MKNKQQGFTLIELLVVIAIIGLLASVIFIATNIARQRSRTAKVQADLTQLKTAIELLATDTGKWPNGCPPLVSADTTAQLDQAVAGINAQPTAAVIVLPCEWTAEDVGNWHGPYSTGVNFLDPWGTPYYFDGAYTPVGSNSIALVSAGEDKTADTSDDVYLLIQQ